MDLFAQADALQENELDELMAFDDGMNDSPYGKFDKCAKRLNSQISEDDNLLDDDQVALELQ